MPFPANLFLDREPETIATKYVDSVPLTDEPEAYENASWSQVREQYKKADYYYSGEIFLETADSYQDDTSDAPLKYPLQINLAKTFVHMHASTLFGQWEKDLIDIRAKARINSSASDAKKASEFLMQWAREVNLWPKLMKAALSSYKYGDCYLSLGWNERKKTVIVSGLLPYNVFPVFDPLDSSEMLECFVLVPMAKREAQLKFGLSKVQYDRLPDVVLYQERWTETDQEVSIGGVVLEDFSVKHNFGFIPVFHIPRLPQDGVYYGQSLVLEITGLMEEINSRAADAGDTITQSAHNIIVTRNLPHNRKTIRFDPGGVVDLGNSVPGKAEPDAFVLKQSALEPGTSSFLDWCLDTAKMNTFTPPVSFGEDEGSQRSGMTLLMRMFPLAQQINWARLLWGDTLSRLLTGVLTILKSKGKVTGNLLGHEIFVDFAPMLPKDKEAIINEIATMRGANVMSIERALELQDVPDVDEELARIESEQEKAFEKAQAINAQQGEDNADSKKTDKKQDEQQEKDSGDSRSE